MFDNDSEHSKALICDIELHLLRLCFLLYFLLSFRRDYCLNNWALSIELYKYLGFQIMFVKKNWRGHSVNLTLYCNLSLFFNVKILNMVKDLLANVIGVIAFNEGIIEGVVHIKYLVLTWQEILIFVALCVFPWRCTLLGCDMWKTFCCLRSFMDTITIWKEWLSIKLAVHSIVHLLVYLGTKLLLELVLIGIWVLVTILMIESLILVVVLILRVLIHVRIRVGLGHVTVLLMNFCIHLIKLIDVLRSDFINDMILILGILW